MPVIDRIYKILWLLIVLALPGCIDPFTPDIKDNQVSLVVEALITDCPGIQTINLSRSSPLNDTTFYPVEGAWVFLFDEEGVVREFSEMEPGKYGRWIGEGELSRGQNYWLHIETGDGEVYESDAEQLTPQCPEVDSVYWELDSLGTADPGNPLYGIQFYLDLEGKEDQPRNYRWELEETWEYHAAYLIQYIYDGNSLQEWEDPYIYNSCWYIGNIPAIFTASTSSLENNSLKKQPLHFVSSETQRLQTRYSLLIRQYALSEKAYDYWTQVRQQNQESGGLYETQPDRIPGNIHNVNEENEQVLGYFNLSSVSEKRIFVDGIRELVYPPIHCFLDTIDRVEDKPSYLSIPFYLFSFSPMGVGPPYGVGGGLCFDCRKGGGINNQPDYWE
ncbi:MAG: DUF4249 domain-containing protein [Bacteroidales bacterium]